MTSIKGAPTDGYTNDPYAYVPAAPPGIGYKTDPDATAAAVPADDSFVTAGAETAAPLLGPPPATGLAAGNGEPPAVAGPNAELLALSPLFDSGDPIAGSNMRRSIGNYRGTQEPNDGEIRSLMHQAFDGSGDPAALKALVSMMPSPADPDYAAKTQHFASVAGPELTKMEQNGEASAARSTAIWSKLGDLASETIRTMATIAATARRTLTGMSVGMRSPINSRSIMRFKAHRTFTIWLL